MAEFDIVDLSVDGDAPESLTPQQHLEKADAAYAAASKLRRKMDEREQEKGATLGKSSDWYLTMEHDLLTLFQIANLHANLATAKSLVRLLQRRPPDFGIDSHGYHH